VNQSKVSIIIPVYNSEKTIIETLENCLYQTWENKEIILVDDGSSDNTLNLVSNYKDIEGVKLLTQTNKGAPAARNLGLENATGDFIQFIDADDLMALDKIERQMECIGNNEDVLASSIWGRFIYETNKTVWENDPKIYRDLHPRDWMISQKMMPVHAWLTPRTIINKAGNWDESLTISQDGEYFYRVIANAAKIKFCEHAKVYYRSSINGSISQRRNVKNVHSKYRVCTKYEEILLNIEDPKTVCNSISGKYTNFILRNYPYSKPFIPEIYQRMNKIGVDLKDHFNSRKKDLLHQILGWEGVQLLGVFKRSISSKLLAIRQKVLSFYQLFNRAFKAVLFFIGHPRLQKEPILITGCGRSGTSLLLAILDAHPNIYGHPHETEVFHQKRKFSNPQLNHIHNLINLYAVFYKSDVPKECQRWCEKTPKNVHHIDEILREFRNKVKIINILRDGRDVCLSTHPEHIGYYISPIRWVNDVEAGQKFKDHPLVLHVKYEDIINSFDETINNIMEFINEDFHHAIKEYYSHSGVNDHAAWTEGLQPIYKQSIKKWTNPKHKMRLSHFYLIPKTELLLKELGYLQ